MAEREITKTQKMNDLFTMYTVVTFQNDFSKVTKYVHGEKLGPTLDWRLSISNR